MTKNCKSFYGVFLASIIFTSFCAVSPAAAGPKIGSVSIQTIINDSEAGRDALEKLKAKMEKESKILKSKQEALRSLEKDFEQQRLVSRPEALEDKERELIKMKREIELYNQDTRRIFQRSQTRMTNRILAEVKKIIKDYAIKNNYTIIVENSEGPTAFGGFVVYVDQTLDITPAILMIYNEQYKSESSKDKKEK